ncbi:MAG: alginate lyase family protein [Proteobacteria bacterium]|nr:alginate lyase family protein [Pseudomonadota bacterium]
MAFIGALRHLRAEQLVFLFWRRVLRQPRSVASPKVIAPRPQAAHGCLLPIANAAWLGGHRFGFLNHVRDFGTQVDWVAAGESRLWQYNLHYFDWLRQLDFPPADVLDHIGQWIAANPPFNGTGWEPYPSSLRLVNWLGALASLPPGHVPRSVVESIALQGAWLEANIEYQLGANHLFVNLKALLFTAAFLGDGVGQALAARVVPRFVVELGEQFLADGGHYERSPMYHAILTQDLLELRALSRRNPGLLPSEVALKLERFLQAPSNSPRAWNPQMTACFCSMTQPPISRRVARSCWRLTGQGRDAEPSARDGELTSRALPASGYFVAKRDRDMVVFDCGEVGPAHQPGHAHCDTLSFELYVDGRRLLTNAGNYDYVAGPVRSHARSTRAHNTVVVDGMEQSEIWGCVQSGAARFAALCKVGARARRGGISGCARWLSAPSGGSHTCSNGRHRRLNHRFER